MKTNFFSIITIVFLSCPSFASKVGHVSPSFSLEPQKMIFHTEDLQLKKLEAVVSCQYNLVNAWGMIVDNTNYNTEEASLNGENPVANFNLKLVKKEKQNNFVSYAYEILTTKQIQFSPTMPALPFGRLAHFNTCYINFKTTAITKDGIKKTGYSSGLYLGTDGGDITNELSENLMYSSLQFTTYRGFSFGHR